MTDEEILRKKLDRLNENSHYGIIIDTEITKIAHILTKRLEEIKMNDIYPLVIVKDRYNGTYSGGKWTAWNLSYVPSKVDADDIECADFFAKENLIFGRGETPEEAIEDLKHMRYYGSHMTRERIKAVSESTDDEEEEKMEPTSVCRIENIEDIWINQDVDGMSLMLKNRDDLTKIVMTGDAIDNFNDTFVISLQADMIEYAKDMRKLEKENEELKAKSKDISNDNALLLETNKKLVKEKNQFKEELNMLKLNTPKADMEKLEKENEELKKKNKKLNHAADYWSKKYDILLEKFAKLQVKLVEMKKPTIELFADEAPSSRRDILRCAEKCVCGHREQDYGTPESNFQLIADLWNGYLGNTLSKEKRDFEKELGVTHKHKELSVPWEISAMDVAMMMALLKIARIRNGGGSGDSFVDLAGYAACGGEIWAGQKHQKDLK